MTQDNLDILCVNMQTSIGLRAVRLVDFARTGDISGPALAANLMASMGLMRSIKDHRMTNEVLTDDEMFMAQEKLFKLEKQEFILR